MLDYGVPISRAQDFFSGEGRGGGGGESKPHKLHAGSYLIRNENKGLKKIYSDSSCSL